MNMGLRAPDLNISSIRKGSIKNTETIPSSLDNKANELLILETNNHKPLLSLEEIYFRIPYKVRDEYDTSGGSKYNDSAER